MNCDCIEKDKIVSRWNNYYHIFSFKKNSVIHKEDIVSIYDLNNKYLERYCYLQEKIYIPFDTTKEERIRNFIEVYNKKMIYNDFYIIIKKRKEKKLEYKLSIPKGVCLID